MLILTVSLLGLAYLQAQSAKLNASSYSRTQATLLAAHILEQARVYGVSGFNTPAAGQCDATSPDPAVEKRCWLDTVASSLPSGWATTTVVGNTVQVSIHWSERRLRHTSGVSTTTPQGQPNTVMKQLVWNLEL